MKQEKKGFYESLKMKEADGTRDDGQRLLSLYTHFDTYGFGLQTNQFAHLPLLADGTERSQQSPEYKSC